MKQLIIFCILCVAFSSQSHAQTVYLADTAFVTDIGAGGAPASCKANDLNYNSVNMNRVHSMWVADMFTIPVGTSWFFDSIIVYGYEYGSGVSSPFTACNLQIYNDTPGAGGTVIWGDTVTNLLSSTGFTGIYKVDTLSSDSALLSTKRPLMYLKLFLPMAPILSAGTYWLAWSATGTSAINNPASPFKVLPGRVNPSGQVARALSGGTWSYITDNGHNVGLDKIIIPHWETAVNPITRPGMDGALGQNIPNPFSNATVISYSLAAEGSVKLYVYNVLGQVVATLADGLADAGMHSVTFNAGRLPAGTYYYTLSIPAGVVSKAMILAK